MPRQKAQNFDKDFCRLFAYSHKIALQGGGVFDIIYKIIAHFA